MSVKPTYAKFLQHFNVVKGGLDHVATTLGGKVQFNIENGIFTNACAIRMSYALNKSGITIPYAKGKTSSGENKEAWYIYNVTNLRQFLKEKFGQPETFTPSEARTQLMGKKGIILFTVKGWSDASGHATLWGGERCADACYFPDDHEDIRLSTQAVEFWELP